VRRSPLSFLFPGGIVCEADVASCTVGRKRRFRTSEALGKPVATDPRQGVCVCVRVRACVCVCVCVVFERQSGFRPGPGLTGRIGGESVARGTPPDAYRKVSSVRGGQGVRGGLNSAVPVWWSRSWSRLVSSR